MSIVDLTKLIKKLGEAQQKEENKVISKEVNACFFRS